MSSRKRKQEEGREDEEEEELVSLPEDDDGEEERSFERPGPFSACETTSRRSSHVILRFLPPAAARYTWS